MVKTGYSNILTTALSKSLERIGVSEIGLKSEQVVGARTLGIGLIMAFFH